MALEALKAYSESQFQKGNTKPTKVKQDQGDRILTANMEREKQRVTLFNQLADNVKLSSQLRVKINKDVQSGSDIKDILADCIQCISLMTGDKGFYEQNIKALKEREL